MKEYIVVFEVSEVRKYGAVIIDDFDTLEEAGVFIEGYDKGEGEIIVCKCQSRNQWWTWDGLQGWRYRESPEIIKAKAKADGQRFKAQAHITAASRIGKLAEDMPNGTVEYGLKMAEVSIHQAKAALGLAKAEYALLQAYLETHGNIEWPIEY